MYLQANASGSEDQEAPTELQAPGGVSEGEVPAGGAGVDVPVGGPWGGPSEPAPRKAPATTRSIEAAAAAAASADAQADASAKPGATTGEILPGRLPAESSLCWRWYQTLLVIGDQWQSCIHL